MIKKISMVVSVLMVLAMTLSACAPAATVAPTAEPTAESQIQPTTPPAAQPTTAPEANKKLKIAVVVKAVTSDYWKLVGAGVTQAMTTDPNIEATFLGPNEETDIEGEIRIIEAPDLSQGGCPGRKPPARPISSNPPCKKQSMRGSRWY